MITQLRYGLESQVTLDVPADRLIALRGVPDAARRWPTLLGRPKRRCAPLAYPPLAQLVVPGDKVCLALDDGVPQASAVVGTIVDGLVAAGIEPGDITLIRGPSGAGQRDPEWFRAGRGGEVQVLTHDPTDRKRLAYLAASSEGKPIYLDRALADADLVIPIGCLRLDGTLGYFGVGSTVFPTFSDAQNLQRFHPLPAQSTVRFRRRQAETDQVSWLLGIQFIVEVLPAGDDQVLAVLAGRVDEVERVGRQQCQAAWNASVAERASLVVAAITGPTGEQTWLNVARALAASLRLVDEGGTIVICSELAAEAGPAVRYLAASESPQAALREIVRERPDDALVAAELAEAMGHGRVYLLSRLKSSAVEELAISPIEGPEQLQRLVAQHTSCILLANAQYAMATAAGEEQIASVAAERPRAKRK